LPRNKYPEETRQKIIQAAIKTFNEKGYEQSTVLDIVDNMEGLTRGAFYHHFKSKEELLILISDMIFAETNPFEATLKEKGLTGLEKLRKSLKINIASLDDEYKHIRLASASLLASPHFLGEQIHFNNVVSRQYIQPMLEEGIKDGSITVENPRLVAELMTIFFNFWMLPMVFSGDAEYIEQKAELSLKILSSLGLPLFEGDETLQELGDKYVSTLNEICNNADAALLVQ